MKRPVLVAVIGYIIGIILGLYFKFSIAFLYVIIALITVFIQIYQIIKFKIKNSAKESIYNIFKNKKFKKVKKKKFSFYSFSRYFRYIKLIINRKVIITIIVFSCLSNFIVMEKNKKFEDFYKIKTDVEITAKVVSNVQEKEYKNSYKIQVLEINKYKKDVYLYLNTDKNTNLKYGDIVKINGNYKAPEVQRNYGGFSYREYLKTLNIYGTVTTKSVEILEKSKENEIGTIINNLKENINQNAKKYLDKDAYPIFLGIILGDTSNIEADTKEAFENSNMSHILAVSGMHITYIVIGIVMFLSKISGKKLAKIISIIVLIFYIILTGFSPSIVRACSTAIIMLLGGILNRKADVWTSIAISLFIILIYNPFLLTNIGLQFSYMGTIGIILLSKNIMKLLIPKEKRKYKINKMQILRNKIKEQKTIKRVLRKIQKLKINTEESTIKQSKIKQIIAVTLSVQIFILPLNILHFNTFGIYFLITNLVLSLIIGPLVILGFIMLFVLLLNLPIANILAIPVNLGIKGILLLTNIGNFPLSKIYVRTPQITEIIIYYTLLLILNFVYKSKTNKNPSASDLRVHYMLQLFKYNFRKYKKRIISSFLIVILLVSSFIVIRPKSLKIHFVDVGQGDCCFIETPENKTILIDGGGSEFGNFDVGESTLLPYILDRGYTKIDYIFISHFDTDHYQGCAKIMEELNVKNVIISKQEQNSKNYEEFKKIVKEKKYNVIEVKKRR